MFIIIETEKSNNCPILESKHHGKVKIFGTEQAAGIYASDNCPWGYEVLELAPADRIEDHE